MSCAAGVQTEDRVYIGVDACASDSEELTIRKDEKIFKLKHRNMIIAGVGSVRTFQIIRYSFKVPKQIIKNDFEYLCKDFAKTLKDCLRENNELTFESETNLESMACDLLIGYNGKLYSVGSDFQIEITATKYNSIGSGASYALGSLHTTDDLDINVKKRITAALKSSVKFSNSVEPPFKILSVGQ